MKPRIFISSTFYDLKYIREDLANFVRLYGYEPVLFEDGDIGYTPGKTLDSSCYESMRNSDMVILIIGCEYGSAASGEKKDEFKEYMSVTRNEFRMAVESGIPIFVMIDKKVMVEYGVYEVNHEAIENGKIVMMFPTTKSINVFRFIKEIKGIVTFPIQEFERSSDIKGFISKQWADMFKNYLSSLKRNGEDKKIENSVNEMKELIQKMSIMLDSVGKNVLANPKEYDEVINQQEIMSFCHGLLEVFQFQPTEPIVSENEREKFVKILLNCIIKEEDIENKDFLGIVFSECQANGYYLNQIASRELGRIKNGIHLLNEEKNIKKIVEIITKEEYFNKLVIV